MYAGICLKNFEVGGSAHNFVAWRKIGTIPVFVEPIQIIIEAKRLTVENPPAVNRP